MIMPTDRGKLYIQFFYNGKDDPFICGAEGNICCIDEIEKEYLEDFDKDNDGVFKKAGDYLFEVYRENDQIGDEGRIELPGYWDLTLVSFKPLAEGKS